MKKNNTDADTATNSVLTFFNNNTIRILSHGRDTKDSLTLIDYVENPGASPPPFTRHEFVEVFTVLEGRLAFQFQDEEVFHVSPGNAVTVAHGESHSFWNPDKTPLHVLIACSPAGLEKFFEEVNGVLQKIENGFIAEKDRSNIIDSLRIKHRIEQTAPAPVLT
jgi:mannose-6-phosphate isomerase-like protein (cupin superfamily)